MEWRLHEKNNTKTEKKIVEKEREFLEYLRRFILEKDFVTLFISLNNIPFFTWFLHKHLLFLLWFKSSIVNYY